MTRARVVTDLIRIFAGFGHREEHSFLVQVGQPQDVGLPLRPMSRLKATGDRLLHSLWRTPFVQPTIG